MLTTAGKQTSCGTLERNSSLGETYAMINRFGPEFQFLTIAFDDMNSPQVFHLTVSQPDSSTLPCIADKNSYLLWKKAHPSHQVT